MNNLNDITIEWPKADVDRLFAAMQNAQKYLNYDSGHALRAAAKHLLGALRTSTKRAPKYRTILPSDAKPPRRNLKAFEVNGFFGRPRKYAEKTVFSRNKATARRRHATIGNSGLAAATWAQATRDLGGSFNGLISGAGQKLARLGRQFSSSRMDFKGGDNFWETHNTLDYITQALRGGENTIETVMARAASGMEQSINRQLVKRMGLGSLSR
jgi:hypothetical protein